VIDYGRFAERLAARTDRWSLLVEFQREWGYVGEINRGFEEADPEDIGDEDYPDGDEQDEQDEEELCPVVPEALAEWYALPQNSFMHAATMYWTHPHMPPTRWPVTEELTRLGASAAERTALPEPRGVFMAEYEYCWTWSYLEREAQLDPDPPVYIGDTELYAKDFKQLLAGERGHVQYEAARSISEWVLGFAVTAVPFNIARITDGPDELRPGQVDEDLVASHASWEEAELTDEQYEQVRTEFPELGLLPWIGFGCYELRGGPDVILMLRKRMPEDFAYADSDYDLLVAARTEPALATALSRIGIQPTTP